MPEAFGPSSSELLGVSIGIRLGHPRDTQTKATSRPCLYHEDLGRAPRRPQFGIRSDKYIWRCVRQSSPETRPPSTLRAHSISSRAERRKQPSTQSRDTHPETVFGGPLAQIPECCFKLRDLRLQALCLLAHPCISGGCRPTALESKTLPRGACGDHSGCELEVRIKFFEARLTNIDICNEDRRCGFEIWINVHRATESTTKPRARSSQEHLRTQSLQTNRCECRTAAQVLCNVCATKRPS